MCARGGMANFRAAAIGVQLFPDKELLRPINNSLSLHIGPTARCVNVNLISERGQSSPIREPKARQQSQK